MHLDVKGCGTIRSNSPRRCRLGFLGAMTYATATSRNVLLEEFLCIF